MKNTMRGLGWMLVWGASAAYAAPGAEGESVSWLGYMFAGFFALVIVQALSDADLEAADHIFDTFEVVGTLP